MYGMVKTTIYLPEALKRRIEDVARAEGRSEADVIRSAIDAGVAPVARPRPRALFNSGRGDLVERWDELMEGFGRD